MAELDIANAPKRDITVQGLILAAPLPYEEGHELTKNEAGVLNQTYVENLRNNYAGKISKACEEAKVTNSSDLPQEAKTMLQKDFDAYAIGYEFGVRGTSQADPVKAKAISLAVGVVKDALKGKGLKLSEVGTDKIREMAEAAVEKNPKFLEKAREIVESQRAAAADLQVDL